MRRNIEAAHDMKPDKESSRACCAVSNIRLKIRMVIRRDDKLTPLIDLCLVIQSCVIQNEKTN